VNERLHRRDWTLILVCAVLAALAAGIVARSFSTAFPQASIDFKYDRNASQRIANGVVQASWPAPGRGDEGQAGRPALHQFKHAASFDGDDTARIFLERSLGLDDANRVMRDEVRIWYWHHRWFRPLVEEEISVDVAPTGHVIGFRHVIPEDRAMPDGDAMRAATAFLDRIGVDRRDLKLIDESQRKLPKRTQRIVTFESSSIRPAGAPYRHVVTVDGDRVTGYSQRLKVPDSWLRSYRELRSKNMAAGSVDLIFNAATMIATLVIFIVRFRRGELALKFLIGAGIAGFLLQAGVTLNSLPVQLVYYDTTTSYPAYLAQLFLLGALQCIGTAMLLIVICGAGEVLYRERLPRHLAMPRIWSRRSLTSKRVFLALIVGYALVPLFMAYQVVFYLTARRIGAWSPAEVPYDATLNTAIPWVMVLFAGFFPAMTEEFLSRAFSIPFLQKVLRSRLFAIVLAGFIWGFGHATYPNQPFWIRGVEVGLVGIVAGFLMDRFGLLPLLIWHYTIDAVYTAALLFASGNPYYVTSAALASLIFAVPLGASIVMYVRNRGFVPDDELTNAAMPTEPLLEDVEVETHVAAELPPPMRVTRTQLVVCAIAILIAALLVAFRPPSIDDVVDYRISGTQAKEIAKTRVTEPFAYVIATPVEGFRQWSAPSPREDGGAPGGFDDVAASYLVQKGMPVRELTRVMRDDVEAANWIVRFFTPMKKEEIFVEIDPRTARVVGYHKYQDEQNPGASLGREEALTLARRAFAAYGMDAARFEVKEALTFQQPRRRDWLFHFEDRTPIAFDVFRRVSVRVAGSEITQFNKHVHVPEGVRRAADEQTLLHALLLAMKLAGAVTILALIVTGLIVASRAHGLPWRRALRWTLALAVIPIAAQAAQYESMLFGYSTSVAWETFLVSVATTLVTRIGLQLAMIFLAVAGLEAALPYALSLLGAEGRARFGRSAAVAALTAVALAVIGAAAIDWLRYLWPRTADLSLVAPAAITFPFPSLILGMQAISAALIASSAVALYTVALRRRVAAVTISALFGLATPLVVTSAQAPRMLFEAALLAGIAWVIARYVLDGNPLAWPLAIFSAVCLQGTALLLSQHRTELLLHGAALVAFVVIAMLFAARRADA